MGLSEKEFEVLVLLVEGCSNARIAERLHRSTKTVDHHVSAILAKLDVHSRAEAITAAFGLGIFGARGKKTQERGDKISKSGRRPHPG
jgi:DNA-binding NarL/FixJ family response regulator